MSNNALLTWLKIFVIGFLSVFLFFIVGAVIGGMAGTYAVAYWLKSIDPQMHGDWGLGVVGFLGAGMAIFGLLGGVLSSLLGQIFVSRRLAKRYGSILGPHPVLKITLLTWTIIIAIGFLLKTLTS